MKKIQMKYDQIVNFSTLIPRVLKFQKISNFAGHISSAMRKTDRTSYH